MREERVRVIGVLSRQALAGTGSGDEVGDWHADLAAGHERELLRLIDDLLEDEIEQRRDLELDDGPLPGEGGSCGEAGECLLGQRCVDDTVGSEPSLRSFGDTTEGRTDVLAEDTHGRVSLHLVGQCARQCLLVPDPCHHATPCRGRRPAAYWMSVVIRHLRV